MPDIHLTIHAIIPEPTKDPKEQLETWKWVNALIDDAQACVETHGGSLTAEHTTKRGPRVTAPTPPPSASVPPQVDLVSFAELGTFVVDAAADPAPTKPERRAA